MCIQWNNSQTKQKPNFILLPCIRQPILLRHHGRCTTPSNTNMTSILCWIGRVRHATISMSTSTRTGTNLRIERVTDNSVDTESCKPYFYIITITIVSVLLDWPDLISSFRTVAALWSTRFGSPSPSAVPSRRGCPAGRSEVQESWQATRCYARSCTQKCLIR